MTMTTITMAWTEDPMQNPETDAQNLNYYLILLFLSLHVAYYYTFYTFIMFEALL